MLVRKQSSQGQSLAVLHLHRGAGPAHAQGRNHKPLDHNRSLAGKIQLRNFGINSQGDFVIVQNRRGEDQADAIFFILDGDCAKAGRNRDGKFTASQETGLLTAGGDQIRFRENPSQALLLEEIKEGGPENAAGDAAKKRIDAGADGLGGCYGTGIVPGYY